MSLDRWKKILSLKSNGLIDPFIWPWMSIFEAFCTLTSCICVCMWQTWGIHLILNGLYYYGALLHANDGATLFQVLAPLWLTVDIVLNYDFQNHIWEAENENFTSWSPFSPVSINQPSLYTESSCLLLCVTPPTKKKASSEPGKRLG